MKEPGTEVAATGLSELTVTECGSVRVAEAAEGHPTADAPAYIYVELTSENDVLVYDGQVGGAVGLETVAGVLEGLAAEAGEAAEAVRAYARRRAGR